MEQFKSSSRENTQKTLLVRDGDESFGHKVTGRWMMIMDGKRKYTNGGSVMEHDKSSLRGYTRDTQGRIEMNILISLSPADSYKYSVYYYNRSY